MAASATFALKPGVWFRRGRLLMVSPDKMGTACLLSGRNSTYRPVQISGTGSEELKNTTPKTPAARPRHQLHRRLTPELGHPKLREHLASAITVMKLSDNYDDFKKKLDRIHPRYNETMPLDLGDSDDEGGL